MKFEEYLNEERIQMVDGLEELMRSIEKDVPDFHDAAYYTQAYGISLRNVEPTKDKDMMMMAALIVSLDAGVPRRAKVKDNTPEDILKEMLKLGKKMKMKNMVDHINKHKDKILKASKSRWGVSMSISKDFKKYGKAY